MVEVLVLPVRGMTSCINFFVNTVLGQARYLADRCVQIKIRLSITAISNRVT
jgi:hypothetical protein